LGGQRGRKIEIKEKEMVIELVEEAVAGGARRIKACEILKISLRTLQRWKSSGGRGDKRRGPAGGPRTSSGCSRGDQ